MPFFTARFASATAKAKAWREHSVLYNGLSYTCVSQDDARNIRRGSVSGRGLGFHPNIVASVLLQGTQFQIIGSRKDGTFPHVNLGN